MFEASLVTQDLKISYASKDVIKGVDLVIPDGKITVIIGANGSGKSTLLKSLIGLIKPSNGGVYFKGENLNQINTKTLAKNISLLAQTSTAPEGIKVSELVSRGRFPYRKFMQGLTEVDLIKTQDSLEAMDIVDLKDNNVNALSGGQKQRVWLAMALAQDTEILLLDEPTTYLDLAYQIEILDLLYRLNRQEGKTIVMVLHDINLAIEYADYIYAIKDGTIYSQGPPSQVITKDLLYQVYGLRTNIIQNPQTANPHVIPLGKFVG